MSSLPSLNPPALQGIRNRAASFLHTFTPKSIICVREGYGRQFFFNDLLAGLTVGIIALPLSLALAIGSHARPEQGLYTAIIGGFIISCLGGSRVQIGGPAGAFMAIIAGIMDAHGYQGLAICTLMAGVILIIMGLCRLGALLKFIPYPVLTGFTSGIAVIIFSQQVKDFLGLTVQWSQATLVNGVMVDQIKTEPPSEFITKWKVLFESMHTTNFLALAFGLTTIVLIWISRKLAPRIPATLAIVAIAALLTASFHLDQHGLETIGSRFNGIPRSLPQPIFPIKLSSWTDVGNAFNQMRTLLPEAMTIAILCAIESLLCAVVADGMIGGRHKSHCELVAQGLGNIGSIIFGGIPCSGVIARTAANVKSGGRTPLAGMVHSAFLLIMMLTLAPYASLIPLSVLAGVLIVVAWNMAEIDHFRSLLRAPRSDIAVLLITFSLTVLVDLTVAVGVGMVLAALLFMKRMSEVTNVGDITREMDDPNSDQVLEAGDPNAITIRDVPYAVEVYEINGPFFFGVADLLKDVLKRLEPAPKVFILRMRRVPAIDASGLHALEEFYDKCRRQHTRLLLSGVHAQPMFALMNYGLTDKIGEANMFGNIDDALTAARQILGIPEPTSTPPHIAEVAREAPGHS